MATHSVSFTSSTEGITFGVHADSFVEALSLLVEEFGEGVIPLYEHTRGEFMELCRAVEEADRAPQLPQQQDETAPGGSRSLREDPDLAIFAEPEGDQTSGVREAPDEGVGREADRDDPVEEPRLTTGAAVPEEVHEVPEEHGPVCAVCGDTVTTDRAKATLLMQGEVRCNDCSTL